MLKRIFTEDKITEISSSNLESNLGMTNEVRTETTYKELTSAEREWLKEAIDYQNDSIPILRRTSSREIKENIELVERRQKHHSITAT